MLTSIVATDRDKVSVMRHEAGDMKWLSMSLTKSSGDYGRVELSISTEVAHLLVKDLLLELAQTAERAEMEARIETELSERQRIAAERAAEQARIDAERAVELERQREAAEPEWLANRRAAQAAALRVQILAEISEDIAVLSGHAWTGTDCDAVAEAISAGDIRHVRIAS